MKVLAGEHILARIVEAKTRKLERSKIRVPEAIVRHMAEIAPTVPSFRAALEAPQRVRIIAEVKKASPSKGVFNPSFSVDDLTDAYVAAGASAISTVTEEDFFQGDLAWISRIATRSHLPVLRKDFVFDPYQIYETRSSGASAILLIVAMLQPDELQSLLELARRVRLDALVEVHDESELAEAMAAGADIIGVNNRNLKTFEVDLETSLRLARSIPEDRIFIVESGIRNRDDIARLLAAGADAFLIGETLLTSGDPAAAIRGMS